MPAGAVELAVLAPWMLMPSPEGKPVTVLLAIVALVRLATVVWEPNRFRAMPLRFDCAGRVALGIVFPVMVAVLIGPAYWNMSMPPPNASVNVLLVIVTTPSTLLFIPP